MRLRNLEVQKLTLIFSEALNFNFGELQFLSAEIYQKSKLRVSIFSKLALFER